MAFQLKDGRTIPTKRGALYQYNQAKKKGPDAVKKWSDARSDALKTLRKEALSDVGAGIGVVGKAVKKGFSTVKDVFKVKEAKGAVGGAVHTGHYKNDQKPLNGVTKAIYKGVDTGVKAGGVMSKAIENAKKAITTEGTKFGKGVKNNKRLLDSVKDYGVATQKIRNSGK